MKNKYILAIDQGTTSTRALIFDAKAQIIGKSQIELSLIYPKDGWVEQNPDEIWETTCQAIKGAINDCHLSLGAIDVIGLTNQRETTIIWIV